jgi:uncharacterized protein YeaO (DUF488 family)
MGIRIKRVSDLAAEDDGERVLVDRYWPRGLHRDHRQIDSWCVDAAPSPELIAWYGHKQERWEEFKRRYQDELGHPPGYHALLRLRDSASRGELTLLYGSRDREYNGARALSEFLTPLIAQSAAATAATTLQRRRRTTQPRFQPLRLLDWGWLAFGLAVPLVLLLGGGTMIAFGRAGVVAVFSALLFLVVMTLARTTLLERRERRILGTLQHGAEGGVSILAPVRELGLALVGYLLGFAALVLVLFGAVYLGKLVA